MKNNPPTLLVLGGNTDQLFLIKTAREMGIRTACLDGNPNAYGLAEADFSAAINFSDLPAVYAWVDALETPPHGVCTMGSDVPHIVAAIAEHYNWCGPSEATAQVAIDKLAMKECFQAAGIPIPAFAEVTDAGEVRACWQAWQCDRVIIKPTDRAGSRGVRLLVDDGQIDAAFSHAREQGFCGQVILEEFVPGAQISTETIASHGRFATPGFVDRLYEGMEIYHPQIMENGGWLPSQFDGTATGEAIVSLVEKATTALGITAGVAKGDVVVCPRRGPMMIEMAARLSGGDFSASLVPLGTGVNYVQAVVDIALGREPRWEELVPTRQRVVANRYFFPPGGTLAEIAGVAELQKLPGVEKVEITYRPGDRISALGSHGDRAGVMVLTGETRAEVEALIVQGYQSIRFKVDGRWVSGEPGTQ